MANSMNCWEYYQCPDRRRRACPAFTQDAGRSCWLIAGTLCGGEPKGVHAKRIGDCHRCEFFLEIHEVR